MLPRIGMTNGSSPSDAKSICIFNETVSYPAHRNRWRGDRRCGLPLARIDPEKGLHKQPVLLDRLTEEICAAHGTMTLDKNIHLELETTPTIVQGDADMLRNLIDNAIQTRQRVAGSMCRSLKIR